MTKSTLIFSFLMLIGCWTVLAQTSPASQKISNRNIVPTFKQKDTAYWAENFRQFRDAIFQKDKGKAKAFFDFPIVDSSNEIWYLVYNQDDKSIEKLRDIVKPFTESDFHKYFGKLFSVDFVKSILKLKTDELFKKGSYQTPEIKVGSTTYVLYATFDKSTGGLELNFASDTELEDGKGELLDAGEFNIIYFFVITRKGHVKFKQIRLAG